MDFALWQKGEPIGRLIDADELIRKIDPIIEAENQIYRRESWGFAVKCRDAIEEMPTIEPQRWIPVAERLPHGSCSDLVNVSIHDDSGDTPFDYTSCGWVTTDGEYWIVDNEINNHVIAWMPLPEPYKERRTE